MAKNAEELKVILDMAANGGKMQAQNEMLMDRLAQKDKEIEGLKNENKELKNGLTEKTKECEEKDRRIEELEARLMCEMPSGNTETCAQGPVLMVNNFYYVLSWPKTVEYVGKLDSQGRMSAGHFIHQTLPDGINMNFVKRVDELTKLEAPQDQRLADAMEKVAGRPTTQNIYGDKNEFTEDSKMVKLALPNDADPAEIVTQITEQQKLLD
jgi:hypothetical protein